MERFRIFASMTTEEIKNKPMAEVLNFIREKLALDTDSWSLRYDHYTNCEVLKRDHRRFKMSGYDAGVTGSVTVFNTAILNEFAYLGIYDYTYYLFLDFYKGYPTLYLRYWNSEENLVFELDCLGTTEIIYRIFELTIMTDKTKRRRD